MVGVRLRSTRMPKLPSRTLLRALHHLLACLLLFHSATISSSDKWRSCSQSCTWCKQNVIHQTFFIAPWSRSDADLPIVLKVPVVERQESPWELWPVWDYTASWVPACSETFLSPFNSLHYSSSSNWLAFMPHTHQWSLSAHVTGCFSLDHALSTAY